ncbi:hypothetical protein Efla_006678 [Eimeria flavescens]
MVEMLFFRLIPLKAASLVCLIGAHGERTNTSPTYNRVSCLDAMNPPRQAAGFSPFKNPKILPVKTANAPSMENGTYGVHVQTGQTADCSAAVDHWKEALVSFGTLPPIYKKDVKPYDGLQNMSFVALFNPKADAKVDCAESPSGPAAGAGQDSGTEEGGENASPDDSAGVVYEEARVLVCASQPGALTEGSKPFTEEEFMRITDSLLSSAFVAAPTLLALSAASLGLLVL